MTGRPLIMLLLWYRCRADTASVLGAALRLRGLRPVTTSTGCAHSRQQYIHSCDGGPVQRRAAMLHS